jgi:flagella basal body P-ring formation protein FlgA
LIDLRPCVVACGLWLALPVHTATSGPVTGDMAVRLVREAMTAAGVAPPVMAPPLRALPECAHPPRVTPRGGSWAAAELNCDAPAPWVRVLRTGSPGAMSPPRPTDGSDDGPDPAAAPTLVAARPLTKGRRIGPDDVTVGRIAGISPALRLDDPGLAVGRKLRVGLGAGQPLTERHLDPALDVEPGQTVTALLATAGIAITTTAEALSGGTIGDRIALRNPSGGRDTEGVIIGSGIVRVGPNISSLAAVRH